MATLSHARACTSLPFWFAFSVTKSLITTGPPLLPFTMSSKVSNVGLPLVSGRNIAITAASKQTIPIIANGRME